MSDVESLIYTLNEVIRHADWLASELAAPVPEGLAERLREFLAAVAEAEARLPEIAAIVGMLAGLEAKTAIRELRQPYATERECTNTIAIERIIRRKGFTPAQVAARDRLVRTTNELRDMDGIAPATVAVPNESSNGSKSSGDPVLSEQELKVLRRISTSQILVKGPDAYSEIGTQTGKKALRHLEDLQLIHRPKGVRSGYTLTPLGREFAKPKASQKQPLSAR